MGVEVVAVVVAEVVVVVEVVPVRLVENANVQSSAK